jgi:HEAT repeat protein
MDKNKLKQEGLAFGRSLQRSCRLISLYTADHAACQEPLQRTYEALNSLLRQLPQFTFGFFGKRVVLNELLTPDPMLESLDDDFFKRNIAAVTFSLGITFREFRRGLGLLITKPEIIEQAGGIHAFLRKNQIEGMRIIPGEKRQNATGDSDLGMDFQSFMLAQTMLDPEQVAQSMNLHLLLQSSGVSAPAGFKGSPSEVLDLVSSAAQAAFVNPEADPETTIQSLTHLIEELSPDFLISALPEERQKPLRGRPAGEVAYVLAEDVALEWARKKYFSAGDIAGKRVAEEEVIQVLGRALRTTQVADRLLHKLSEMVAKGDLPASIAERVRDEMNWSSWTLDEKHSHLMSLDHFPIQEYRHLLDYLRETGKEGNLEKANAAAERYMTTLESESIEDRIEGMGHLPEIIRTLSGMHSLDFVRKVVDRFCLQLRDTTAVSPQYHAQVATSLATAAQSLAMFEDFESAIKIGTELERSTNSDRERHAACCAEALHNLLNPTTVERLIEMTMRKHSEVKISRAIASLLRLVEMPAAEIVFRMLEEEQSASGRSRLLHIARQLGDGSFRAAQKRLEDERWYVVRNACYILGALNDPQLAQHLEPALRHSDSRVQQAAVTAIVRSAVPGRGGILVSALPALPPHLQEMILDELVLLKDPTAIDPLEGFLLGNGTAKMGALEKAMRALLAIPDERVVDVLGSVLMHAEAPMPLRKNALQALKSSPHASAQQRLAQFRQLAPNDPLAQS